MKTIALSLVLAGLAVVTAIATQDGVAASLGPRAEQPALASAAMLTSPASMVRYQEARTLERATPAENALLRELDGSATTRDLAGLIVAGYHHAEQSDEAKARALATYQAMLSRPEDTYAAIETALGAPALSQADMAYGRASMLTLAAQVAGDDEQLSGLMHRELTERPMAPLLEPSTRMAPGRPEVAVLLVAHDLYLSSTDLERGFSGTLEALAAQPDPELRARLAGQFGAAYPEMKAQLLEAAERQGTPIPAPVRPEPPPPH